MDMMEIRFRMMAMQGNGLDTSPVILEYNKRYENGNSIGDFADRCITKLYDIDLSSRLTLIGSGGQSYIRLCVDGAYRDWYSWSNTKNIQASNANQIAFTLQTSKVDDSYVYIQETGRILFAGKNSIYYGHTNISELN